MSWPTDYPPRDLPGGDFAVVRSDGSLRRWHGHLWRWTDDQHGHHYWQHRCQLPSGVPDSYEHGGAVIEG